MTDDRVTNAPPPDPRLNRLSDDLHTLAAGHRVGRYEIQHVLGHGGFGITYRAHDTALHRDVAVKEYLPSGFSVRRGDGAVLPRSTEAAETFLWGRERFVDEARTLARLERATGIVNVHDIVQANGTAYMVMEFLRGETLEALLKRDGRLSPKGVERLLPPLLDGLEQVHQADFLHRDIKPANILIDETGTPKLIDFGASRMAVQGRTQAMTAIYTPGYAAPEQMTLAGRQGPWTDIYALGATLYHCVAGTAPAAAIDRLIGDPLTSAREVGAGRYAPALLDAIDAALQLKPAERPRSVADWRRLMLAPPPAVPVAAESVTAGATRAMGGGGIASAPTSTLIPAPAPARDSRPAAPLSPVEAGAALGPAASKVAPPRWWKRTAVAVAALGFVVVGFYAWRVMDAEDPKAAAEAARLAEDRARLSAQRQWDARGATAQSERARGAAEEERSRREAVEREREAAARRAAEEQERARRAAQEERSRRDAAERERQAPPAPPGAARRGVFAEMTDATVCLGALDSSRRTWEARAEFASYRDEALRRGYDVERCRRVAGGAAPEPTPPIAARQGRFDGIADATLCRIALDNQRTDWERRVEFASHVDEARSRGFSVERCRDLTR